MRAVDTNVLIRYIIQDDPSQQSLAEQFFEESIANREPVLITVPVLCEFCWVSERGYGRSRPELSVLITNLLETAYIQFDCDSAVRRAFERYRHGRADFADYLIGELSEQAGCRDIVTFDRALRGAPGFTLLTKSHHS